MDLRGDTRRQYELAESGEMADAIALLNDWKAVGGDLAHAMKSHNEPAHV